MSKEHLSHTNEPLTGVNLRRAAVYLYSRFETVVPQALKDDASSNIVSGFMDPPLTDFKRDGVFYTVKSGRKADGRYERRWFITATADDIREDAVVNLDFEGKPIFRYVRIDLKNSSKKSESVNTEFARDKINGILLRLQQKPRQA